MCERDGKSVRHGKARKKGENVQKGKEDRRKSKRQKDMQDEDTQKCTRKQASNGETKYIQVREGEHL